MNANHHLNGLRAILHVGLRGAARLAAQTTVPPKVAVEELVAHAEATLAAIRRELLAFASEAIRRAAHDCALVERLSAERKSHQRIREDQHGPFLADRLWISTLLALLIAVIVTAVGSLLALGAFEARRPDLVLVLVLAAIGSFVAGDWAGRAHSWARAVPAVLIVTVAIAATCAVGVHHDQRSPNLLVDLLVVLVAGGAGLLAGRARRLAPAIRRAEQEHRLEQEIHEATKQANDSDRELDQYRHEYTAIVDEVAAVAAAAVEAYLRQLDDQRIASGLFDETDETAVRSQAEARIASWPRELELVG